MCCPDVDINKRWMIPARSTPLYLDGVRKFIQFAVRNSVRNGQILYPCSKCSNRFWLGREEVHEHLIWTGFMSGYTTWIFHGECIDSTKPTFQPSTSQEEHDDETEIDEIEQLLVDGFGMYDSACLNTNIVPDSEEEESADECDEDAETFRSLAMKGSKELYEGCNKFSKLQFLVRLLNIKNKRCVTNVSFEDFLELFRDALLEGETLPKNCHELKKFIKVVSL
jgi:hypothetical protein